MTAEENGDGLTSPDSGSRAERPPEANNKTWGWSSQQHPFDNLAKGLADGTLSRRRALWLLGTAFVGGWLFLTSGRRGFAQDDFTSCAQRDPSNCPAGYACCPRGVIATKDKDKDDKKGEEFVCTPPELIPEIKGGCSCPANQELCKRGDDEPQCVDVTCEQPGQFFSRQTCQCEAGAEGTCPPLPSEAECNCDPNNPPPECCCPGQEGFDDCIEDGLPRCPNCCFLPCEGLSEGVTCNCVPTLDPGEQPGEVVSVTRCVAGDRNNCSAPECSTSAECRPGQVCVELTDPRFGCGCNKNICVPLCGINRGGVDVSKTT